jgi:arylsulfatase
MKQLLTSILLLATCIGIHARPALEKPNVIVVFVDDSGYADYSHTGNPTVHTPNISKMAHEGLSFPQFYVSCPACSASRYGLLTGRNQLRSGFPDWVINPTAERYIHPDEVTIAEGLKNQGYATAMFGKWHVGNPNINNGFTTNALPLAHGFDMFVGTTVSHDYADSDLLKGPSTINEPVAGYEFIDDNVSLETKKGLTKRYGDGAVEFIDTHKDHPFFIYVAPNMPHLDVQSSEDFVGTSLRGDLGDCLEEIDHMVGRIRTAVETAGITTNTLIVFTSDNGPWISHRTGGSSGGPDVGYAQPFRDGKGSTWEGGVRVPGVFLWPDTIAPAVVERTPASTLDLLPTIFTLAGEPLPTGRTLDGRDISPFLNASAFPGTVPDFSHIYTGIFNRVYGARKGVWKLHIRLYSQTGSNHGFTATEADPILFNVEEDIGERFDVADQNPAEVATLEAVLQEFNDSHAAEGTFWD